MPTLPHRLGAEVMAWLISRIVLWWVNRCGHPGRAVAFDIAEGGLTTPIGYCRRCGAVRLGEKSSWRLPEPTWWVK